MLANRYKGSRQKYSDQNKEKELDSEHQQCIHDLKVCLFQNAVFRAKQEFFCTLQFPRNYEILGIAPTISCPCSRTCMCPSGLPVPENCGSTELQSMPLWPCLSKVMPDSHGKFE